jgi:nicotinamidase/pyrazinamidase
MSNVLLVVDMLNGFLVEGKLANPNARKIILNVVNIVQKKIGREWKILFLADNHKKNDLEFLAFPEHCVEGTIETGVIDELSEFVTFSNYIPKTRYSGLFNTNLGQILENEKSEEIIVVGLYADICILYTAAELRNLNYKVTIPKDCTMTLAGIDNVIFDHMKNVLRVNIIDSHKDI